jgi:hypothetical protein
MLSSAPPSAGVAKVDERPAHISARRAGGSLRQAAQLLGIVRQTLRWKLRDLGLLASRPLGRRVAELRVADSGIREAQAQADSIADTIAFQVNQAYRELEDAHAGIDHFRPAADQARETYRSAVARSR